jgi:hypothetical protein
MYGWKAIKTTLSESLKHMHTSNENKQNQTVNRLQGFQYFYVRHFTFARHRIFLQNGTANDVESARVKSKRTMLSNNCFLNHVFNM